MRKRSGLKPLSVVIPADSIESTVNFYETHAREYFDRTVSADLSVLYKIFLKHVRPGGRVLDAGCGSGRDLKILQARGFDAVGIDASNALVKLASQFSGATCLPMRLENVSFSQHFDAVWACASLLHLPKRRIPSVLRRFHKSLVDDGVLFASVQAGQGEKIAPDGRFFAYYAPNEFAGLVEKSGFSVDDVWISKDSLPGRGAIRWINIVAHRGRSVPARSTVVKMTQSTSPKAPSIAWLRCSADEMRFTKSRCPAGEGARQPSRRNTAGPQRGQTK
jgi:SAM-dependent methyltransferase